MEREDVGMRQRGDGLGFTIEARAPLGIARDRLRQNLDGDVAIEPRIAGAIDLAHATRAKRAENFVATEPAAGGQGHAYFFGARWRNSSNQFVTVARLTPVV